MRMQQLKIKNAGNRQYPHLHYALVSGPGSEIGTLRALFSIGISSFA